MSGIRTIAGDADRTAAVDELEPIDDGAQIVAEVLSIARHVVNGQHHHSVHALFTDPLWGDELCRLALELPGVVGFIEVHEAVAVGGPRRGGAEHKEHGGC